MSIIGNPITIGGGSADLGSKSITTNGTYTASDDGFDGYSDVTVNVSGSSTLVSKTITSNGTYNPADDNADGYSEVTVSISDVTGESTSVSASGGSLVTSNCTVTAQPSINGDEMTATSSLGLALKVDSYPSIRIEFDYIIAQGNYTILSFGGSNTNTGIFSLGYNYFRFYANAVRFTTSLVNELVFGNQYHVKIELLESTIKLYIDDVLLATGETSYVNNVIDYIVTRNTIALGWNQSWHAGEYNSSVFKNLVISYI